MAESYGVGIGNHSLHRCLPDGLREQAVVKGVRLEDFRTYMADGWGGPFLVGKPEELRRLVNAVPSPCNGVTLCTGMDIVGGDVPALIEEFAGKPNFSLSFRKRNPLISFDQTFLSPLIKGVRGLLKEKFGV